MTGTGALYARLREDLVTGFFAPGARLQPRLLAPRYAASAAALREALIRLAAEGFADLLPQRGFRAAVPTPDTVWDIAHFRIVLEAEAARLAMDRGGVEWEANLTAAHRRLEHLEARMRGEPLDAAWLRLWSASDRAFHEALIGACGSRLLLDQHRIVFDRFKQHVVARDATLGYRGAALVREHADILEAALRRDPAACAAALGRHFETYRRAAPPSEALPSGDARA